MTTDQKKPRPRVCAGCGKPIGTWAIDGAYWHLLCYRGASEEQRNAARLAMEGAMKKTPQKPPA